MSIIPPGVYKIKNKSTSNYIAAHSGDQPLSIIRTAHPKEPGTFPVFTLKIEPFQIGGASIASTLNTHLYVGIPHDLSHGIPNPESEIRTSRRWKKLFHPRSPFGINRQEPYAYERDETREVWVHNGLPDVPGTHWILEKVEA
ncbi:hypothetical protein D9757_012285 [Collybiopsis confluens]|uniref:Uncharacterized protein n=1 Tax=Collybiopsis confluens TaxID=2823264 RepID=A0A8H5LSX4_9AGAR|nr:hypothetical protein D9757_012285 [Collybiopsis confluens]